MDVTRTTLDVQDAPITLSRRNFTIIEADGVFWIALRHQLLGIRFGRRQAYTRRSRRSYMALMLPPHVHRGFTVSCFLPQVSELVMDVTRTSLNVQDAPTDL